MSWLKRAGRAPGVIISADSSGMAGYDLVGSDVLDTGAFRRFSQEPERKTVSRFSLRAFDISSLLRLRTFIYLIVVTVVLLLQIYNTLTINDLAKKNEQLREQLRISSSITTAQELEVRRLQSVRYISGYARQLGLESLAIPPVEIEP